MLPPSIVVAEPCLTQDPIRTMRAHDRRPEALHSQTTYTDSGSGGPGESGGSSNGGWVKRSPGE